MKEFDVEEFRALSVRVRAKDETDAIDQYLKRRAKLHPDRAWIDGKHDLPRVFAAPADDAADDTKDTLDGTLLMLSMAKAACRDRRATPKQRMVARLTLPVIVQRLVRAAMSGVRTPNELQAEKVARRMAKTYVRAALDDVP